MPPLPASFVGETAPTNSAELGVEEFYQDPYLLSLIEHALANNRELKILNEEVQIASTEILARSGAYLPFMTAGPVLGLDRPSNRTIDGAALKFDEYVPGKLFSNPHGVYQIGTNLTWQLDIYRQLRNARDAAAQRYVAAIERRNDFLINLVAEIAENYYRLMALDKRIENLDQIIAFLEQSLQVAQARKEAARDTELAVLRFEAEVRRNQSEKLIINQSIIEVENRINLLAYRYPQPVPRNSAAFYDLVIHSLDVGIPSDLLQYRPDIRQAERQLQAAGLDVEVARANFYPQLILDAGVGLQAFNISYLFMPQAVAGNVIANFIGPLVNRRAIRAEFLASDARQKQAVYSYQLTILKAFTEVVNRLTEVRNYTQSVEIKRAQLLALEQAVDVANQLFQFARTEYLDVLTAQRDLRDARTALIDTKELQLTAFVRAYQALGGGALLRSADRSQLLDPIPNAELGLSKPDSKRLSAFHFNSPRFSHALRASLRGIIPENHPSTFANPFGPNPFLHHEPTPAPDDPLNADNPTPDQPPPAPFPIPSNLPGPFASSPPSQPSPSSPAAGLPAPIPGEPNPTDSSDLNPRSPAPSDPQLPQVSPRPSNGQTKE
jgi:NodT family efflux transporter outer membrane factor (OMF) lipoprotein